MPRPRAFHRLDPRSAHLSLVLAVALAVVAWFVAPGDLSVTTHALIAWDVAAVVLFVTLAWIIVRSDTDETRRRAASHDPGRTLVWLVVLATSAFSLFAAIVMMREVKSLPGFEKHTALAFGMATVALSWFLTHAAFTLRYAHLFYRGGPDEEGGIDFADSAPPRDLDFAYVAFTIGMCFQVSDTSVKDRVIRTTVLGHAILSFAYNTGIVALMINVIGQLG